MKEIVLIQCIYILRLVLATVCGIFIGYERENNMKLAGIRTHSIVALTSALMMLISKHGFYDVLGNHVSLDPSRIAAGIVTAIGFLGAGVIFTRKLNVTGLTTAAGLWATVGIGMAIGSGLYPIGIAGTILILLLQYIFHKNLSFIKTPTIERLILRIRECDDTDSIIRTALPEPEIKINSISVARLEDSMLEIRLYVSFPEVMGIEDVLALLRRCPEIITVDLAAD